MPTPSISPKAAVEADRNVGAAIAALRKAKGISQTALGEAAGVTFQQLQKYESGHNRITVGRLHVIADHLGVPPSALMGDPSALDRDGVSVSLLGAPDAAELLLAFAEIRDPAARRNVIDLVRSVARTVAAKEAA